MKPDTSNRTIFLVEDNPIDIDLTRRAFSKVNMSNQITVARDGEEALSYIPQWEKGLDLPVIILLDLKLPKVDGLEVLRCLKEHPVLKVIPVIVLTSSLETRDIQTAYKLGANSYINKPVDFDEFIEVAATINLYWNVINVISTR
jgi:CheY-like chemotaxis protein